MAGTIALVYFGITPAVYSLGFFKGRCSAAGAIVVPGRDEYRRWDEQIRKDARLERLEMLQAGAAK